MLTLCSGLYGQAKQDLQEQFESFTCEDAYVLQYKLIPPTTIEEGTEYPLVLCLHGMGGGTHAEAVLAKRKTDPCFVLVPRIDSKEMSWTWNRTLGMPYVFEAIDAFVKQYPIDTDRIYVTGQSMGGRGAWGAIAMRPDFFAAAVPVCGGWKTEDATKIKDIPVWVFHGDADAVVPVKFSREMVKAIQDVGGKPKYTEFEGVNHNSWVNAYDTEELWEWMFAQRLPEKEEKPALSSDNTK